jgi:membrane protein implicated in regulation of membrane protease activity
MALTYVFALVVGLGILGVQAVLGSKEMDAEGDVGAGKDFHFDDHGEFGADHGDFGADHDADCDVDHGDLGADADLDADHEVGVHDATGVGGFVALFLSTRFWIFASLGFGLGGTLLSYFTGTGETLTFAAAVTMGIMSGLSAALAFRALRRGASEHAASTDAAVGRLGRVIVPCEAGGLGQIRIEVRGQSVDMRARTGKLRIERGDTVIVEVVEGDIATVSRAPEELQRGRD